MRELKEAWLIGFNWSSIRTPILWMRNVCFMGREVYRCQFPVKDFNCYYGGEKVGAGESTSDAWKWGRARRSIAVWRNRMTSNRSWFGIAGIRENWVKGSSHGLPLLSIRSLTLVTLIKPTVTPKVTPRIQRQRQDDLTLISHLDFSDLNAQVGMTS